jgi:hypothetical protein
MQSAAVDDGDASMALALVIDELLHLRDGFRSRLAVQVESAGCGVVSAFDLSKLTPIDTRRDISLIRSVAVVMSC